MTIIKKLINIETDSSKVKNQQQIEEWLTGTPIWHTHTFSDGPRANVHDIKG